MPDTNEPLSRGRFLKLCAAGALGLAVTFAAACGEEDEEEDEEDEEDGGGGLY
jgi:hypothetical protein